MQFLKCSVGLEDPTGVRKLKGDFRERLNIKTLIIHIYFDLCSLESFPVDYSNPLNRIRSEERRVGKEC